jgi:hypothetical protein
MISQPQILDNFKLFAGQDVARSAGITPTTLVSPTTIANGEIVITDASNVILNTATVLTANSIKIVAGRGAGVPLWESQLFTAQDILNYKGLEFQPKVQQVSVYGFNPATGVGSFDVINDNYYTLVLSFYELLSQEASSLMNPIVVDYLSGTPATQEDIVLGLYRNFVRQLSYWTRRPILAEVVNSAVVAIAPGVGGNITWTQGSPIITCGNTAGFAVGDYVRLGLGITAAVYKITQVTATSFTVSAPLQTSGTLLAAAWEGIAVANAVAGNYGIRVTGLNQPFILDSRPVSLVSFQIGISNGGATNLTYQVGAFIGHGTYEQMRTMEATSWRNQGQLFTYTEFPPTTVETNLVANQNYSTLNIVLTKPNRALTNTDFRSQLCIACALDNNVPNVFDTNFTGDITSVVDVLDSYITNFTSLPAQLGNL